MTCYVTGRMLACVNASTAARAVVLVELFTEAPREGHPSAVRAPAEHADAVEKALTDGNRCNWLIGYGEGVNEYCGKPGGPACHVHEWYANGWV